MICLIVSSSSPHSHLALSTIPARERYWFNRQCPVLAWMRIEAWSEVRDPYSCRVCFPGRTGPDVIVYYTFLIQKWPPRGSAKLWPWHVRHCNRNLDSIFPRMNITSI